jgi:hypothetical protein
MTTAQRAHFDLFGFLVVRQLLTQSEVDTVSEAFDAVLLEDRQGKPFGGAQRQVVNDWFRRHADAAFLEHDTRIRDEIHDLLSPQATLKDGNDGNYYVGDTGWHPDLGWDPSIPDGENDPYRLAGNLTRHYVPSIKVAFYLDPVGRESGCLRVIPGSHRNPFHDRLWSLHMDIPARARQLDHVGPRMLEMWERETGSAAGGDALLTDPDVNHFGTAPRDLPCAALDSQPGDVVFFSHQLWHASFGGRSGRRMFTLNFLSE